MSPKLVCPVSSKSHKNESTCDPRGAREGHYDLKDRGLSGKTQTKVLLHDCMDDFVLAAFTLKGPMHDHSNCQGCEFRTVVKVQSSQEFHPDMMGAFKEIHLVG